MTVLQTAAERSVMNTRRLMTVSGLSIKQTVESVLFCDTDDLYAPNLFVTLNPLRKCIRILCFFGRGVLVVKTMSLDRGRGFRENLVWII